ncbi:MAG: endonuclease/exonuclease/phosphatase family protein [Putridiphycobacter sp.]
MINKKLSIQGKLLLIALLLNLSFSFAQEKKQYQVGCIGFYNLENLFNTVDDPNRDEEYLPEGRNNWTEKKYQHKLENLSTVLEDMGTDISPDGCGIIGVAEVENRGVLEDLVKTEKLKSRNYKIIHYDSPDRRGIDVGLLYQEKYLKVNKTASYKLVFPDDTAYYTRDQLIVGGKYMGEDVNIIVAHWPSRRGGEQKSEPRRIQAAQLGRKIIDSLYNDNPNAKIIYMGDLNDDPVNKSVTEYIQAKGKIAKVKKKMFFNPMWDFYKKGHGTLAWNDAWNLFDQIMVSKAFLNGTDYSALSYYKAFVYRKPYLLQKEGRFKGYPLRTSAGGQYLGGYSDHLPVFIVLIKELTS